MRHGAALVEQLLESEARLEVLAGSTYQVGTVHDTGVRGGAPVAAKTFGLAIAQRHELSDAVQAAIPISTSVRGSGGDGVRCGTVRVNSSCGLDTTGVGVVCEPASDDTSIGSGLHASHWRASTRRIPTFFMLRSIRRSRPTGKSPRCRRTQRSSPCSSSRGWLSTRQRRCRSPAVGRVRSYCRCPR